MYTASTYNPDSQPLGHYKGYPVYLATVLVAVHIVGMLLGVVAPEAYFKGMSFAPGWYGSWAQVWRWVTYVFVHQPSLWFVLEMYFLFRFGMEIEKVFGRKTLARLYGGLILLPPALVTLFHFLGGSPGLPLAGTGFSHFCLFLGICFLYPGALMFCSLPWLTLKLAGSIFLGIYILSDLASRSWMHPGILLANTALTYFILRHAGLTPRFEAIQEAFRNALPSPRKLKALPAPATRRDKGSSKESAPATSRYYEPKIKPKADLAPERKAVEEIDAILDKIAKTGMNSLTGAEKLALQKASTRLKDTDY